MLDIKITGAEVLDGTGSNTVRCDVGITGDTITAVADLSGAEAAAAIDATGKLVCPGFIDAHSHSDAYLLIEPSAPSKLYQGITTEVVGNCGASAAPLTGDYEMPSDWRTMEYPGSWSGVGEYREFLESVEPAPNVCFLAGHKAIRVGVMGAEHRKATAEELEDMKLLLEKAIEEGARGLSTGLIYAPAMYAGKEELVELMRVVADRGGIYTTHMRSEGKYLLGAIEEAIDIGRQTGSRVEISHLKTSGRNNWHLVDDALGLIRSARDEGLPVAADRYPYTSSNTDLDVIFPDWAQEGGAEAVLARLKDPSLRERLREDLLSSRPEDYWATVTLGSTWHPDYREYQGMCLVEAAEKLGMEPVDAVLHLVEAGRLKTSAFFAGMNEDNMKQILAEPYVMIGTDASLRAPEGPLGQDYPHPRAYASFTRFLRMSLDGETVALPEAVRKMTSLPADHFQLTGRGRIAEGMKADVVVIDTASVKALSDYGNPHQLSEGIEEVIINGVPTISNGKLTGNRAGQWL